jgi:hypothetical protein
VFMKIKKIRKGLYQVQVSDDHVVVCDNLKKAKEFVKALKNSIDQQVRKFKDEEKFWENYGKH